MTMKKINILLASAVLYLCCGCEDLFTPAPENYKDAEQMNSDAQYAQRILMNAYRIILNIITIPTMLLMMQ